MTVTPAARLALYAVAGIVLLAALHKWDADNAAKAVATAVAEARDSVRKADAQVYQRLRDSARLEAVRARTVADSARAVGAAAVVTGAKARRQAERALAEAAATRDSVARATPGIQAAFDSLTAALTATTNALARDSVAFRAQAFALDSLTASQAILLRSLARADTTLHADALTIASFKALKTPSRGLLAHVADVGLKVGALAAAALLGHAL